MLERLLGAHIPEFEPPRIEINSEKCTGCGYCVRQCPGQLIVLKEKKAVFVGNPFFGEVCVACWNCKTICPEGAIEVKGFLNLKKGRYRSLQIRPQPRQGAPNPFREKNPPPFSELEEKITEVEKVIYRRRSNRVFKKERVPRALLERILEAGRFAPSGGNCQPWQFIVVENQELLKELADGCIRTLRIIRWIYMGRHFWNNIIAHLYSWVSPGRMDPRLVGGIDAIYRNRPRYDLFLHAPVVIFIAKDARGIGKPLVDCALCAHNMVLTAHALGLGTCYIGLCEPINMSRKLKNKLGLKWPYDEIATAIALGYPAKAIDGPVEREFPQIKWLP